ncbi:extracellular solute-binding protein [Clostridium omnivorum]|uniref:Sugar ABC transporter substrate-binding protein n=1 Tax=Clostridium omnivorum TaxID=1604902 RepID=A0ABQ5N7K0_9CLOT|nr:extracellular solute-binding protein [Clostridium sp. E14]GLC31230.1 sugar ABC transporter substrate-binding protein [Clostridium sp. E14]
MSKKFLKRISLLVLGATIITSTLVGCTSSGSKSANSGSSSDQITLKFTYRDDGSDTYKKWIEEVNKKYNNPKVKVVAAPITASEGDYFTKISLALKSGVNCPDIVTEDTFMLNSDASAGYLDDLTDKLNSWDDWKNQFSDPLKKGVTAQDGKVYAVPYSTDSRGLWYNKEVFKKAGLPENWQPKNWDEVLQACQTIKEKCPDVVPFWMNSGKATGEATSMQTYEMLLYGASGTLYDSSSKKWVVNSNEMTDALNFVDTIYKKGYGPSLSLVLNGEAGNTFARKYMPTGKVGIGLDGYWTSGNWAKGGPAEWADYTNKVGFAPFPTSKGQEPGTITMAGGWSLAIPKQGKNKEAAMEFVKFAMNKENMLSIDKASGFLTTRKDVAEDKDFMAIPFNQQANDMLKNAQFRPAVDKYPSVSTEIQAMVESVAAGTKPADAIAKYSQNVTRIVGSDKVTSK